VPPWHALDVARALARLGARPEGLVDGEVAERARRHGPNELPALRPVPAWRILVAQLRTVIAGLLIVATALAVARGETADGIAIGAVLVINVALGFVTELRGRRAMEGLRSLVGARARVVRNGTIQDIAAPALVPGDILVLNAGDNVPADARLIATSGLSVMEASLTGESVSVEKRADVVLAGDTPLPDRANLVFQGTTVVTGRARAAVVATGQSTELGRIGTLVAGISEEKTTLERLLDSLGRRLAAAALAIAALIALVEVLQGAAIARVVQTGIAVAVAAVPEGLPVVVTVAMAIGVHRMARRNALVRRLPSLETLGAATVICTDKTQTLTSGEMALVTLWLDGRDVELPVVAEQRHETDPVFRALRVGALASRLLERMGDNDRPSGETPEDRALLDAARQVGIDRLTLLGDLPEVAELTFSSARRLTATFHRSADGLVAFVKGAPGSVVDRCDRMLTGNGETLIGPDLRERIRAENERLAGRGLRVLALAEGLVDAVDEERLRGLTFVGFAGMIDPPAPRVKETVATLHGAGIRIIMLTGDHVATANAVARELDLARAPSDSLSGAEIDRLTDEELVERVANLTVAGRVSPDAKLRIVSALQERGEVVAMLGDGVNDAAALRKADIGVAMGRRGTDAAREVAGVVLADDRFETIAVAVEEGRAIFDNIRRFVFYLFSCNLGELVVLLAVGIAGMPLALLPLQLLWLNIVTDSFPALALAFEPAEADVMRQPPRDPGKQIMSRSFTTMTVRYGLLIGAVSFLAYLWGYRTFPSQPAMATTLTFMTVALAQLLHLGNARSRSAVLTRQRVLSNRYALGALVAGVGLQLVALYQPGLRQLLALESIGPREWVVVAVLALVPAVLGQALKVRKHRGDERRTLSGDKSAEALPPRTG
jgi:Ca2+-transporting ATPase